MNRKGEVLVEVDEQYLKELEEDSKFLGCLQSAGVDGWDGYELAQEMFKDMNE